MDRRAFLATLGGSLLAAPLAAEAQTAGKVYRVGVLTNVPPSTPAVSRNCPKAAKARAATFWSGLSDARRHSGSAWRGGDTLASAATSASVCLAFAPSAVSSARTTSANTF